MKYRPLLLVLCMLYALACRAQSDEVRALQRSLTKIQDSLGYVDALNRLALLLYEKNVDSTFEYTVKARQIADRLNYRKGKADALNNLGVVFDIKGNHQLALKYYGEANLAYTKLKDTVNRVQTFMNIAGVYKQVGRDQRAIDQFEMAMDLGSRLQHDSILSLVIYNYLLQHPERFKDGEMDRHIQRAKRIATRYQDERTLIAIDQLIADELITHGEREAGLTLLDDAINAAFRRNLYYVSMDMLISMGDYLITDDADRAAAYYRKGLAIAEENQYLFYSQLMARRLFDLYASQRKDTQAVVYGRLLVALDDQQQQLISTSSIDYLDYVVKEQQVDSLATKSRYQRVLLILAILVCLFALCFIVVIRRTLARTKNLNHRINDQNQQMRKALVALEQSQAENTRIMQIVAHDLRNPIGAISAAVSMVMETAELSDDGRTMLELVRKSADNSLELVGDLLHIHVSDETMSKEPVDLDQLLRHCVDLLESKAIAKEQRIELNSRPSIILANREKLWRVVSNLIANSIKFSPLGAVIVVKLEIQLKCVVISVEDHGIGIPEAFGEKIFDMFTEAKRPGTMGEEPFGLGLAITKQIVEAHGGQIHFESYPGSGTTFFVELPTE